MNALPEKMTNGPAKGPTSQVVRIIVSAVILALLLLVAVKKGHAAEIQANPSNYKDLVGTLKPGDTLNLAAGTYPLLSISNLAGTAAARITIQGPASGAPAIITINPANPGCCNLIQFANSSFVGIKNLRIDSAMVDGVHGVDSRNLTHNILVENCTFVGQGSHQQTVGISTKGTAYNWTVRGNTILEAGTGMYFGDSTGNWPFINGTIENNIVVDTIGYNMQIKYQNPYTLPAGLDAGQHRTIIRNNVFIKSKPRSAWPASMSDGDRPNLLVGGQPSTGPGSSDIHEIYGNFFFENKDGEPLIQGSGNVAVHDNVFVGGTYRAISLVRHDNAPIRRAYVYNNTVYGRHQGIAITPDALEDSMVTGNLILADNGVQAPTQKDNIVDTAANAANYVNNPSFVLGSMDFFPKPGRAKGAPLDLSKFTTHLDYARDFNGNPKGAFEYRGAYAGEGTNPGWALAAAKKNVVGSSVPVGSTDSNPPGRPQGLRVR